MEHAALQLAGIGLLALVCQWIAWQLRLPAILTLLVAGIAAVALHARTVEQGYADTARWDRIAIRNSDSPNPVGNPY